MNDALFLAINASPQASQFDIALARGIAEGSVPLVALILAGLWIFGDPRQRAALLTAGIAAMAGLGVGQIIALVWFVPRPAVVGIGRTLLAHAPDNSFPSDHATLLWTLGCTLVATTSLRGWGWLLIGIGVPLAWARIYLGLHFPFDMAGAMVVSVAMAILARHALPFIARRVLPPINALYEFLSSRLHIPVPRDGRHER